MTERAERTAQGYRRFRCRACGKQFNERSATLLNRTQYPSDVVALVVPKTESGEALRPDQLRAELREKLSSYKVPRHLFLIHAAEVPYLTSQKADRRALAARAAELSSHGA